MCEPKNGVIIPSILKMYTNTCESKKHLILKGFISGIVNFAYERFLKNLMVILRPPCVSLLINDQT
jgi:hypothetical protein